MKKIALFTALGLLSIGSIVAQTTTAQAPIQAQGAAQQAPIYVTPIEVKGTLEYKNGDFFVKQEDKYYIFRLSMDLSATVKVGDAVSLKGIVMREGIAERYLRLVSFNDKAIDASNAQGYNGQIGTCCNEYGKPMMQGQQGRNNNSRGQGYNRVMY